MGSPTQSSWGIQVKTHENVKKNTTGRGLGDKAEEESQEVLAWTVGTFSAATREPRGPAWPGQPPGAGRGEPQLALEGAAFAPEAQSLQFSEPHLLFCGENRFVWNYGRLIEWHVRTN